MREQASKIEKRWRKFQEAQQYTDEQLAAFRSNPGFVRAMEHAPKFVTHKIVVEVYEARHCNAGHKVGDKFVMTGNGYLIRDECPKYMCVHAVAAFAPLVYGMFERFYEDLDPNKALMRYIHCPDVGPEDGKGWGECKFKMYAVEAPKEKRQD